MKKNIAIIGWNSQLNDKVAITLAERLDMYYLSLSELACYHACRPTKKNILDEGGIKLYDKFYNMAIDDAVEFENSIMSASLVEITNCNLHRLINCACVIFINDTRQNLKEIGVDVINNEISYSRQRYQKYYDIFIKAENKNIADITDEIIFDINT